jgi:hypothetical protein
MPARDKPPLPLVRVLLPRCPFCGSKAFTPYARRYYRAGRLLKRKSDDATFELRYCRCARCGNRFNVRAEWPDFEPRPTE